jgi:hypothetical protein
MRSGWLIVPGLLTLVTQSPGQEPAETRDAVKVLTKQAERQAKLLRQTMAELRAAQAQVNAQTDGPARDAEVDRLIRADPDVAILSAERDRVENQLVAIRRVVVSPGDPVFVRMQKRSEQLADQYEALRAEKQISIRAQLQKDGKDRDRLDRALNRLTNEMEHWNREGRTPEPQP